MDWTGLGVLAALMVGCVGYLARQLDRRIDSVRSDIDRVRSDMSDGNRELSARIERLSDAYVRHLEHHAGGS